MTWLWVGVVILTWFAVSVVRGITKTLFGVEEHIPGSWLCHLCYYSLESLWWGIAYCVLWNLLEEVE